MYQVPSFIQSVFIVYLDGTVVLTNRNKGVTGKI